MKKRYLLPLILLGAAAVSFAACGETDGEGGTVAVLTKTELTMSVGAQETLTLSWVDETGNAVAEGEAIDYRWTCSDVGVVTVTPDGNTAVLTAIAEGEATVSVYDGEEKLATCLVKCVESPLSFEKTVPEGKLVLRKGGQATVRVNSSIPLTGEYEWSSSDDTIATVEYQGAIAIVTAKNRGDCTITVRNGAYEASFVVSVGLT